MAEGEPMSDFTGKWIISIQITQGTGEHLPESGSEIEISEMGKERRFYRITFTPRMSTTPVAFSFPKDEAHPDQLNRFLVSGETGYMLHAHAGSARLGQMTGTLTFVTGSEGNEDNDTATFTATKVGNGGEES